MSIKKYDLCDTLSVNHTVKMYMYSKANKELIIIILTEKQAVMHGDKITNLVEASTTSTGLLSDK
jgi:hypothetical protein